MKLFNQSLITAPQSLSTSFELFPIYMGNIVLCSIQLVFTGSPTGTFKLQCTNDPGNPTLPGKVAQSSGVVNWTDIDDSSQNITEGGNHTWNVTDIGYLWLRVVYTATSGTGSLIDARVTVKGI